MEGKGISWNHGKQCYQNALIKKKKDLEKYVKEFPQGKLCKNLLEYFEYSYYYISVLY